MLFNIGGAPCNNRETSGRASGSRVSGSRHHTMLPYGEHTGRIVEQGEKICRKFRL